MLETCGGLLIGSKEQDMLLLCTCSATDIMSMKIVEKGLLKPLCRRCTVLEAMMKNFWEGARRGTEQL